MPYVRKPSGNLGLSHITVDWHRRRMGMMTPTNITLSELAVDGMEVGDARCAAMRLALSAPKVPEFLFFIDYDVLIPYDALAKLLMRSRHFPDYDIFAGVYCTKTDLPEPLLYKGNGGGPFWDWAVGDLLYDITAVHMGCTMIRTSLLAKMENTAENPAFKSSNKQRIADDGQLLIDRGTEDIYFCKRAIDEYDAKILVDTGVLCGHQNIATGKMYGLLPETMPIQRAKWMSHHEGKDPATMQGLKKAIDIGAGPERRSWEGHWTYTMDIRAGADVDYVQDALAMNLPDNHFDLVASSHFIEHIGRWDQEKLWDEMWRILKPGGRMEHVVPNIQWAAGNIMDGCVDEHVMNVLYGAQEAHDYARGYNTHYFGYTPDIALAMCERLQMRDIRIRTFKSAPELGYNMIISAVKPIPEKIDTYSDVPELDLPIKPAAASAADAPVKKTRKRRTTTPVVETNDAAVKQTTRKRTAATPRAKTKTKRTA
jgi:SAM-dependent methyltransferase